jgi:DNA-binding LacI/PurR family transcriptional regulator
MMSTLKEVARLAQVDPSTVSRVLNNDQNLNVRAETRARILDAVKKLNYKPNGIARSLRLRTSNTFGVLVPDIANPFFPEIIKGAEAAASAQGYHLILCNTNEDKDKEKAFLRVFSEKRVDGLIIATASITDEVIDQLDQEGKCYVLINRATRATLGRYVLVDNVMGALEAVEHLIDLGHRKIAFLSGPLYTQTALGRLEGYRSALQKRKIPFDLKVIREGRYYEEDGYTNMLDILKTDIHPTAVFCANDLMALGALAAIKEAGLSVPADISLVGFDDIPQVQRCDPPLTTVRVPLYQMGHIAVEMLLKIVRKEPLDQDKVLLNPELVTRRSTALPPRM